MLLATAVAHAEIRRVDLARRIAEPQQPEKALQCLAQPLVDGARQQSSGSGPVLPGAERRERGIQLAILACLLVNLNRDQLVRVLKLRRRFTQPVERPERRLADGRV